MMMKNPPAVQETEVRSLGREDPLEEGMGTHSSVLAGESHGQRSQEGYSRGLQRAGRNGKHAQNAWFHKLNRVKATHF